MTSPESVADFSQVQLTALVELMLMAASADGVVSDIENRRIARNVEKSTNGAVGAETLQNMMTTAINRIDSGDRDSRLASIKKRLRAAAAVEGALRMAIQVAFVDGKIGARETQFLTHAAAEFGLSSEVALQLLAEGRTISLAPTPPVA
ncbi:MAG: TerB family tellurite resistance protein [Polyangiaceae bacterium]|nr:TerB family tellurite resistance protein [Polyangiaceae bacterium]